MQSNENIDEVIKDATEKNVNEKDNIETYIDNLNTKEDEVPTVITKDVLEKDAENQNLEDKEIMDAILDGEIYDVNYDRVNLYIVELTPDQANKLVQAVRTETFKPEEQKDKDFLDKTKTANAPSYADFNGNGKTYKVFRTPSEAVQYSEAIKRAAGIESKLIGNTDVAKRWLNKISEKEKYADVNKDIVAKETKGIDKVDDMGKKISFKKRAGTMMICACNSKEAC